MLMHTLHNESIELAIIISLVRWKLWSFSASNPIALLKTSVEMNSDINGKNLRK